MDEALQLAAVLIQDPKSGIAGSGQLACDGHDFAQHCLEVELSYEPSSDVNQPAQTMCVKDLTRHRSKVSLRRGIGGPKRGIHLDMSVMQMLKQLMIALAMMLMLARIQLEQRGVPQQ